MKMRELLFQILRCSLWREDFDSSISVKEFAEILRLSEEQTVLGLVFDVLQYKSVEGVNDRTNLFQIIGHYEKIKQQNIRINQELTGFVKLCNDQQVDYIIVKGQTIGCLYPKPELRQSGDIDFLIQSSPFVMQKFSRIFGITIPELIEKEISFKRNGITYELHTRLIDFSCKRHQQVWEELIAQEWILAVDGEIIKKEGFSCYTEIADTKVRTLSPTMNAAYVFIHLFFHLIREGVSLRQFCDWVMILHHFNDEIDRDRLLKILNDLDLLDAYCAFGSILVDELGLPVEEFPFTISDENRKWKGKILDDIFRGGNFGKLNHNTHSAWKFKLETLRIVLRNIFRYYTLCPSEICGMIPRLVGVNLKLLLAK